MHRPRAAATAIAPGPLIGPLPGTIARTAFLPTVRTWTPPTPTVPRLTDAERLVALETGTGLDALRLLSPPPGRRYLGGGAWAGLFEELGTELPREYLTVMDLYGAGCWSRWLRFLTPLRTGERRYLQHVESTADAYRQLKAEHRSGIRSPPGPSPAGSSPSPTRSTATTSAGSPRAPTPTAGP
ncbi:hypothetical protein AB0K43_24950 [Kitasatospora sp. NPDC049258]|uniref:hypothetical protein n=1 Tax=Kitasatospora sp. NPDC049258 TaxID=3155394 RepID=UPI00341F5E56